MTRRGNVKMDVKLKPHYWIYKEGKDVWNQWMDSTTNPSNQNIRDFGGIGKEIKRQILDNIRANCLPETALPKPSDEINFK